MINYGLIRCVKYQSLRTGLRNARRIDVEPQSTHCFEDTEVYKSSVDYFATE